MFALKVDIQNWCRDHLNKDADGKYLCPFENKPVEIVRVRGFWKVSGCNEDWIWSIEDLKRNTSEKC